MVFTEPVTPAATGRPWPVAAGSSTRLEVGVRPRVPIARRDHAAASRGVPPSILIGVDPLSGPDQVAHWR